MARESGAEFWWEIIPTNAAQVWGGGGAYMIPISARYSSCPSYSFLFPSDVYIFRILSKTLCCRR